MATTTTFKNSKVNVKNIIHLMKNTPVLKKSILVCKLNKELKLSESKNNKASKLLST